MCLPLAHSLGINLGFCSLVVEKEAPYNYGIYAMSDVLIERGDAQVKQALEVYKSAKASGRFNVPHNNGNIIQLAA